MIRLNIALTLLLAAGNAIGQPLARLVTLHYEDERLEHVLNEITNAYQVRFAYSSHYVPIDQRVDLHVVNRPLKEALDTLFALTAIVYKSVGNTIVLRMDKDKAGLLSRMETSRSGSAPNPYVDERMAEERRRLSVKLPEIDPPVYSELPGGDRVGELNLEKYRLAVEKIVELIDEEPLLEEAPPAFSDRQFAQVSIFPYIGTNAFRSNEVTNNLSLNLFWGSNGGVDGVEVGGFVNDIAKDVKGIQVAGLGNSVNGNVTGTQVAGFFNVNGGHTQGFQFAGLFNATRRTDAVQLAGLFNISGQDASGMQFAGLFNASAGRAGVQAASLFNASGDATRTQVSALFNTAGDISGGQMSLLFNKAKRVDGFQFGLINVADTVAGLPIGLLNFVKRGYNRVEVAGNEALFINMGMKLGAHSLYNILHLGARWDRAQYTVDELNFNGVYLSWGLGYGLGTAIPIREGCLMNIEVVSIHVNEMESWTKELNLLNQLRISMDKKTGGRASFFAGPVWQVMVSKLYDPDTGNYGSGIPPYAFYDKTSGDTNVKMWIGFYAGMRL